MLTSEELSLVKKEVTVAMRYIKAYHGPSRTWFAYQDSLQEGCNRLASIVSGLPVSKQTSALVIDTLLRLDKKLCNGGVDDSDGTVGDLITTAGSMLEEYVKLDPNCAESFEKLKDQDTCFGWEEPLIRDIVSK